MVQEETHLGDERQAARFAVWQHLMPGDIFSEAALPQPLSTDSPLPQEKQPQPLGPSLQRLEDDGGALDVLSDRRNTGRPFLTEGDVNQWRDTEVCFADRDPDLDPKPRVHVEPPALSRKGFWPGCGPVRYRAEFEGSPAHESFRDFFPPEKIGETPLRPDFEERVRERLQGNSPLPKCALGGDWDTNKLFPLADMRRKIEGRKLPTVLHAFALAVYEVEEALNLLHPELPSAAVADFCQSYDLWRHLCYFARALERYGLRLGMSPGLRAPGLWEDEIHRGLLHIWNQLAEYATKLRLRVALEPAAPQGTVTIPEPAAGTPASAESVDLSTIDGRRSAVARWKEYWPTPDRECTDEDLTETAYTRRDRSFLNQWINEKVRLKKPQSSDRVQSIEDALRNNTPPVWHPAHPARRHAH